MRKVPSAAWAAVSVTGGAGGEFVVVLTEMVSGASLMSKKMLLVGLILTRALVLVMEGRVSCSLASLGVSAARVMSKVWPPLVERRICRLVALMGLLVVPAIFHSRRVVLV